MSTGVAVCAEHDTLVVPARIMRDRDCGGVPVVDDDRRVVGMITDRDLCMAALDRGVALDAMTVETAMSRRVFLLRAEDSVDDALALMSDHQVRRVPIVDAERRIVGVVSINDLARAAVRTGHALRASRERILATMAAICTPRPRDTRPGGR